MAQGEIVVAQSVMALFTAGQTGTASDYSESVGQLAGAFKCPHCNQTVALVARFTDASTKGSNSLPADVGHVSDADLSRNKEVIFLEDSKEPSSVKETIPALGHPPSSPFPSVPVSNTLHSTGPVRPSGHGALGRQGPTAEFPLETRGGVSSAIPLLDSTSLALLDDHPPKTALTRHNKRVAELFHLTAPPGPTDGNIAKVESVVGPKREVPIPGEAFPTMYEICFGASNAEEVRRLSKRQKDTVSYVLALLHDTNCDLTRLREFWSWWKKWATFPNPTPVLVHEHWGRFVYETANNINPVISANPLRPSDADEFEQLRASMLQASQNRLAGGSGQ